MRTLPPRGDAPAGEHEPPALPCAQAGARAWNGVEVGMDWWGWVILALVIIAALVVLAVVIQRKRRRGGVIGLSQPESGDARRSDSR
ncbi:MAG: hypothetical protein WBR33_05910 [Pseudonocardiaceae bacterium]